MQNAAVKRRAALSLWLFAAILSLFFVLFFTLRGSADPVPGEIENFGYQTVAGDSPESDVTSLRFLFTVGSLDYTRVGFVFSKTNIDPTVGGDGCHVHQTTTVHTDVYANGNRITASDGRFWVAVKVTEVPNASFDEPIYVRPFVEDGSGVRYGDLHAISAEGAFSLPGLQSSIAAFTNSNFGGGSVTANLGNGTGYNALAENPTKGQHPRVLFTESDLPGIRTAYRNAPPQASESYDSVSTKYAATFADPTDGDLSGGFDPGVLNDIQLLALDYRMTGNPYSGYLAIYAIKNALKTTGNWKSQDDYTRMYGMVMYDAACVYDWCYDLLTSSDKQQIVLGVQNKCCSNGRMEIGFPPSDENAVTGHGAELQLLRDYLSFAIAIYDEYPGWWNYIADRFYDEYVPVRNEFYEAGMYPQGTSLYVRLRFASDLYSAWLVKTATGVFPYASEANMKQVMRTVYSYELTVSGHKGFASGDDHTDDWDFIDYGRNALLSSYLFDDATMRALLARHYWSYSYFYDSYYSFVASVPEYLICSSTNITPAADRHEGMPLILYNGGWLGQIIARNSWSTSDATAILMKIGCRTSGNHDHADAGQFQIWYKDVMLAGDTGSYDDYGDSHFTKYHQATVAHNSILIDGAGQKQPGEPGSYANWQTDTYKTGEVTGVSCGYDGSTPTYAYIAGNLQPAYSTKADTVNRRMLTVFDTDDENAPAFFFVFDRIKAKSGSYKKTFLLHVPTEPTIEGNRVSVVSGERKLVLQSVLGGDSVTKIGGAGHNYEVNGVQYNAGDDGYWGRVEISPNTGNLTNNLLNVMYVCDGDSDPNLAATRFCSSEVEGAVIGNTAAVFVKSSERQTASFTFTAPGEGPLNYYVSGVAAGDWKVWVGGSIVGTVHATSDGGFVAFTAAAGAVTLSPYNGSGLDSENLLGDEGWVELGFGELPTP